MHSKISYFFSIIFLLFFCTSTAQIDLGRIGKKAENKVERKIDKKITKGIDDAIDETDDAITGKDKKKNNKGKTKVITETKIIKEVLPNGFRGEFMMNTVTADGENILKVAMVEYQTAVRPLIIKQPHNLMIYDKKEETLTTINNTLYKGKAMRDWMIRDNQTDDKKDKETLTLTKTTDVSDINGYIARKYIVEGNDMNGVMWLTKEIDADFSLICDLMGFDKYSFSNTFGFPLKIEVTLADGTNEKFSVDGISETEYDKSIFDVSAYQLIDMTDLEPGN